MRYPSVARYGVGGGVLIATAALLTPSFGADLKNDIRPAITKSQAQAQFLSNNAGANFYVTDSGVIGRVYGKAFSGGATGQESVDSFIDANLAMWGTDVELRPGGRFVDGRTSTGLMYRAATDDYKFTGFYYEQVVDGIPVHDAEAVFLVRNEGDNPLVLVSSTLRDLDVTLPENMQPGVDAMLVDAAARNRFGDLAVVTDSQVQIFAGKAHAPTDEARLAYWAFVKIEHDEWRIIVDAGTGEIIHEEHAICFDVDGNVGGLSTEGIGAEQCENEVYHPMPYLRVAGGGEEAFTDVNGDYTLPSGGGSVTITAGMDGIYFDVINFAGAEATESDTFFPPGPGDLLFNSANNDELIRGQVNTYVHSNIVRDLVVAVNPTYPEVGNYFDFPAYANRNDGFCPGNAWYSPGERSINFCTSGGGFPNTSWSSVVHHEYGHHLVEAGGSGQGQYGEGMGDVMSTIILDSNFLGWGFFGDCNSSLRNADNNHQYPCNGGSHDCGQLISGCVWDTRNELVVTEPANYTMILADLAVNAILVHTGSTITPQITIDYLTLDDNDGDIGNGTPHYNEIDTGFSAHNMDAPDLSLLDFTYPNGLPGQIDPNGGTTVRVEVGPIGAQPEPGTGMVHIDTGSGYVASAMNVVSANVYDAVFPAVDCGTTVHFYFSAETTGGSQVTSPSDAPASAYQASAAFGPPSISFQDDFETDNGWSVSGNAQDGQWDRGVPVGGGDRGDPPTDGDGSGQCYLTDNVDDNSDVDGGTTTLTSPVMDASGNKVLAYHRWYDNTFGAAPGADTFVVEVSDDGGSSWVNLETVGPTGPEASGGWFYKEFAVADIAGITPNANFRIRFHASDLGDGSVVEAGVDGVTLFELDCDGGNDCPGDADGDGMVGTADLLGMLGAWGTGDPVYDIAPAGAPDGIVDVLDILELLSVWGACP